MNNYLIFILTVIICLKAIAADDATLNESRQLGYCEGVYIYAAQFFQANNNSGAAVNILSRGSRVVAANFFLNKQGDTISRERLEEIKSARRTVKPKMDSNPSLIHNEIAMCDKKTLPIIKRAMQKGGLLWGKSFVELNEFMLAQYKKQLGL